jgi:hypothetical protein
MKGVLMKNKRVLLVILCLMLVVAFLMGAVSCEDGKNNGIIDDCEDG